MRCHDRHHRFAESAFTPEGNDRDIAERADWSNAQVIDELERGMTEAGPLITRSGGRLDGVALGEWVHAGDVRDAFGEPGAYAGGGLGHALVLGALRDDRPPARYTGDAPALIRLCTGRPLIGTRYELVGAKESELNLFG